MVQLKELVSYTNQLLEIDNFKDYGPNGLQVEGKSDINKIISGVSANMALIEKAIAERADAILVHHGLFWQGVPEVITGIKKNRIAALLKNDISLIAYHLPLDAHTRYGNNVELGRILGIKKCESFEDSGFPNLFWTGILKTPLSPSEFYHLIEESLGRAPVHINANDKPIQKVGWCTGGAQDRVIVAAEKGCDAYITGEISERNTHMALENDIHFYAAGHHATERHGIQALSTYLAQKFKLEHQFVDIDNPV